MHYVYLLRSISNPDQTYIGFTENLKTRLAAHNQGQSPHTSKFKPWELITYLLVRKTNKYKLKVIKSQLEHKVLTFNNQATPILNLNISKQFLHFENL